MKKSLLFLIGLIILYSCAPDKPVELTKFGMTKEDSAAIIQVVLDYQQAYEKEDFGGIIETLSKDVIIFGTDSAEVIKSLADFKEQIRKQWELYDKMKFGPMFDIFMQSDKMNTMASVVYGVPLDVTLRGQDIHYFLRVARTLKKENDKWVISSGLMSITSTGQATTDLIQQNQNLQQQ